MTAAAAHPPSGRYASAVADVACVRCCRNFVAPVAADSWRDRWLSRLRFCSFRCQVCNARFRKRRGRADCGTDLGRRQYLRLPVALPARLRFKDGSLSTAGVENLSIGGCEIRCDRTLEAGTRLTVLIAGLGQTGEVEVEVAVVYASRHSFAGLKFLGLAELALEELGRFLYVLWIADKNMAIGGRPC